MTLIPAMTPLIDNIPSYQVDAVSLLPADWSEQLERCSADFSQWQDLTGESVTSREAEFADEPHAHVGVVTGDVVLRELPWLDKLYRGVFLELVNAAGVGTFECATDLRAGININTTLRGARYEWHVDSNPMTALLFATTHEPEDGGQLMFRPDPQSRPGESWELSVSPRAGTLLVFDAREAAHVVSRLEAPRRISVPMNYYFVGRQDRPADLDDYLYHSSE